jgi:NAD(P)-dependent dehydrogenase (short-subunit alcohol dehydrogenase family)
MTAIYSNVKKGGRSLCRPLMFRAAEAQVSHEEYYAETCSPLELKRFNTPQEVASLVYFLLSEEASGITGRDWLMQTIWNQL